MFDLFSLKRKTADRDAIAQTPTSVPVSAPPTKRRKVDTDGSSQSKLQLPNRSPLMSSVSGSLPPQWSRENSTDARSSDDELYGEAKRRKWVQSLGNYNIPVSQGTSQNSNSTRASNGSQATEVGPDKPSKSARNFGPGPLPSFGQDGHHTLPSWSRASVYSPATSVSSPLASRSQNSVAPETSANSQLASNSSKATLYTPDCMRIDALSRYKVNVPPETITAPSPKSYPGSAPSFKLEPSDNRFILPTPTLNTNRGHAVPDKLYRRPPNVIQRWSHANSPLTDLDEMSMLNSHHSSPVSSPSVAHSTHAADSSRYVDDGNSRSSLSLYYQPSSASTSTNWPSNSSLPGYQRRSLPSREPSDRLEMDEQASESAADNSLVPVCSPKSAYNAEDPIRLSTSGASAQDSRKKLSDSQRSIALHSGSSTDNVRYIAESGASGVTATPSHDIRDARESTSCSSTARCSIYGMQRASYPESTSYPNDAQASSALSTSSIGSVSEKESVASREVLSSSASRAQMEPPPLPLPLLSDSSSSPNTPKTPCLVQVLSSSSMSSANSMKSIHPVLSRLKSSEPLQHRRSPGSNLSLSGLQRQERSVSIEPNDRETMSSAVFPLAANSTSTGFEQNSYNNKESLSLNGYDAADKQLEPQLERPRTQIRTRVDDSCSQCGISASMLVEYAKGQEELVVKKKQWEMYFSEDQAQKATMREEVESMKEQIAKMQAEYEITRMDSDSLRMDRDNLKQKVDTQQKFINSLSQQLDEQRDEMSRVEARLLSGGIDPASKSLALSLDSSVAVNSPPATSESVSSVSETYDCGLNEKGSDTSMHDEMDACREIDKVVHQMITRSRASRVTSEVEQQELSKSSIESVAQSFELDHILASPADPILFRRKRQFTSRSPFPVESAVARASSSIYGCVIAKAPLRPGRKMRPRLLFDGSNMKALHVHRVGKFGNTVLAAKEVEKPSPFGLEPKNAVPVLRDYILGFRDGVIVWSHYVEFCIDVKC
ncbi:hypothetical protein V1525DRAFT_422014 [Lipomyces kononenkoae]|uniref:Uncharacterized protein n=1 Tax=Lipomyces kononenkoae TaxID=34357 RepID=A0ACC3SSR8_LIPKO